MIGDLVAGLGVVLGFAVFMPFIYIVAEGIDRFSDWAWNKFSDWYLRRCGES